MSILLAAAQQIRGNDPFQGLFKDDDDNEYAPNVGAFFNDTEPILKLEDEDSEEEKGSDEDNNEEEGEGNDPLPLALMVPDEIWLPMATRFFDLETLNSFMQVCRRFYGIATDVQAIANVYLRRVAQEVLNGNYDAALRINWQGIFRTLWSLNLITPEASVHIRQLLNNNGFMPGYLPQAMHFMNEEILAYPNLPPVRQNYLQRLWTQGTLLFRAESEPNGMFLREVTGACNALSQDMITSGTVQRLLAILSELNRNPQIHVAAIHGLGILFTDGVLSDKEMEGVLTTLLRLISQAHYKSPVVLAASQCMQTLLLGSVLTDIRREAVLKTIIRVILSPRTPLARRIQLMHTLDVETLAPVLSPRLRALYLECLPLFIRNNDLHALAKERLIQLLRYDILSPSELTELGNALHPLIHHDSERMRARMIDILTEGILAPHLSLEFRQACITAFRELLKDPSTMVLGAIFENLTQIYEYHEDFVPLPILYDGLMRLLMCQDAIIAHAAVELLKRFHVELSVQKVLASI